MFKPGTVRIFARTEVLSVLKESLKEYSLTITENYVEFQSDVKVNSESWNEYLKELSTFIQENGFYYADIYMGKKYGREYSDGRHNINFLWSENYEVWEKEIFNVYGFDAEIHRERNQKVYA